MQKALPRNRSIALVTALLLFAATACSGSEPAAEPALPEGASAQTSMTMAQAQAILQEVGAGDSAAMAGGTVSQLEQFETDPALKFSIGSLKQATAIGRPPQPFTLAPLGFALPAGSAECLIVGVSITGPDVDGTLSSVLQLTPSGERWLISHAVIASAATPTEVTPTGAAVELSATVPDERLAAMAQEIFQRAGGEQTAPAAIAASDLLDSSLAAGITLYRDQLAAEDTELERTLEDFQWSACGTPVAGGTLTFVTLSATDQLRSTTPGSTVTLSSASPDAQATGQTEALSGDAIDIRRLQMFLVLIPGGETPGTVLGAIDTAVEAIAS